MGSMEPNPEQSLDPVVQIVNNYYQESYHAKRSRMFLNADNFNCYHLKQDYSHKRAGQSKEFLPKVNLAVEQLTSFMQQGLISEDEWFGVDAEKGMDEDKMKIKPKEMLALLDREFRDQDYHTKLPDGIKLGLLGSLMILKVHGGYHPKDKYFAKNASSSVEGLEENKLYKTTKNVWGLRWGLIRQEDWYPDPTGEGLYDLEVIEMDWYKLEEVARANPDIYDIDAVMNCGTMIQQDQKIKKSRETDQNTTFSTYRRRVKIKEVWGDILEQGTGRVLYRNAVCAVANDHFLIRPPKPNPFWHGERPYVVSPIIRVPTSVWHKSLMDAATRLNRAQNELYNLQFDSAMMSTFGIKQVREAWLDDPAEIDDGVFPGATLKVNSSCPPGQKVIEVVQTGGTPQESMAMFQQTDRELQAAMLTSDLRMGLLPQRQVKATEIVASNQTITGMFNGVINTIEMDWITKIVKKSWLTCAQYWNDLDIDEMTALFGPERARQLHSMSAADRFADTVQGRKYKVFGISQVLNRINDFRKIQSFLQTLGTSPVLTQEFAKKYSFGKLLTQIIKSLDIDTDKIKNDTPQQDAENNATTPQNAQATPQELGNLAAGGGNQSSQIPSAANPSPEQMPGVQRGDVKGITTPGR